MHDHAPSKSEFTVENTYHYPLSSAPRWIFARVAL